MNVFPRYLEIYAEFLNEIFNRSTDEEFVEFTFQISNRIQYFNKVYAKVEIQNCFLAHIFYFFPNFWKNYFSNKQAGFYNTFLQRFEKITMEEISKTKSKYFLKLVKSCSFFNFGQKDFEAFNDFAKLYCTCWERKISPQICKIDYEVEEKTLKPLLEGIRQVMVEQKSMAAWCSLMPCVSKKYIIATVCFFYF
jgi:hypothetical protein